MKVLSLSLLVLLPASHAQLRANGGVAVKGQQAGSLRKAVPQEDTKNHGVQPGNRQQRGTQSYQEFIRQPQKVQGNLFESKGSGQKKHTAQAQQPKHALQNQSVQPQQHKQNQGQLNSRVQPSSQQSLGQQRKLYSQGQQPGIVQQQQQVQQQPPQYNRVPQNGSRQQRVQQQPLHNQPQRTQSYQQLSQQLHYPPLAANRNLASRDLSVNGRRVEQVKQIVPAEQLVGVFSNRNFETQAQTMVNPAMTERETIPEQRVLDDSPTDAPTARPVTTAPSASPVTPSPSNDPTPSPSQSPSTVSPTSNPTRQANTPSGANVYNNPDPETGPWKECIGWEGHDCKSYILEVTSDNPKIGIITPADEGTIDEHRVFVFTSIDGLVIRTPERG